MSSKASLTVSFSKNDEELVLKAIQTSMDLLRQIEVARNHVERAFRVQIEQNAEGLPVSEDDSFALEFILMELASIKTTVEVDQFFPIMFFSHHLSMERTCNPENAATYATLRKFTEKYTRTPPKEKTAEGDPTSDIALCKTWSDERLAEIERFANFDAVDFSGYLKTRFAPADSGEPTSEEENSSKDSGWSSDTLVSEKGKMTNETNANGVAKVNGSGNGSPLQTAKTKTKNKSLFKTGLFGSVKRKDSKRSNKELVAQSKVILDRCERIGK